MATKQPDAPALPITRTEAKRRGATRYFTGKPCSKGHCAPRWAASYECCVCAYERVHTDHRKSYMAAYQRERRKDPAVAEAERAKSALRYKKVYAPIYSADPEHRKRILALNREYYRRLTVNNPEKVAAKRKRDYELASESLQFRLRSRLRARFHRLLAGKVKAGRSMDIVGCSVESLMAHLESLFQAGMTWENFGKWHIDHIRPCASFDLTCHEQQRICFHYTNLQPLWAIENLSKGAKYDV